MGNTIINTCTALMNEIDRRNELREVEKGIKK